MIEFRSRRKLYSRFVFIQVAMVQNQLRQSSRIKRAMNGRFNLIPIVSMESNLIPIVSKTFCSHSLTTLMVRKRPHMVNGGGFVVINSSQKTIFTVDGCGVLGTKNTLIVRDEEGSPILQIQKKCGVVQVLSSRNRWKGYVTDNEGENKVIFSVREMRTCFAKNEVIRICIEPKGDWEFEIHGSFTEKACILTDCNGALAAEVVVKETMASKDFYHVVLQPGYDQAFVVGVIAVLDYIHGESTRC